MKYFSVTAATVPLLALLFASVSNAGPTWRSPPKGSIERAQIMDALRAKLSTFDATSNRLVFVVKELCLSAQNGWLAVEPQSRDGQNRLEPVQASLYHGPSGWAVATIACGEEDCPKGTDAKALRAAVNPQCE